MGFKYFWPGSVLSNDFIYLFNAIMHINGMESKNNSTPSMNSSLILKCETYMYVFVIIFSINKIALKYIYFRDERSFTL